MTQDEMKKAAAMAAIAYVEEDSVVGVGTGSTVNYFIEELGKIKSKIEGAVASSEMTAKRLKANGIPVLDLNVVSSLPVYIDGADEANQHLQLVKGGGGALTREKILACVARKFICIIDDTKKVDVLGKFPIAVEVIPMARSYVAREIVKLEGDPVYRQGFTTDNGNIILDVYNLTLVDPAKIERELNNITGVICNGIFAKRTADVLLVGSEKGVVELNAR